MKRRYIVCAAMKFQIISMALLAAIPFGFFAQVIFNEPDDPKLGTGSFVIMCTTTGGKRAIGSIAPREHWVEKVKYGDIYKFPVPIVAPSVANIMIKKCLEKFPRYTLLNSIALVREPNVYSGATFPVVRSVSVRTNRTTLFRAGRFRDSWISLTATISMIWTRAC